MDTPQIKIDPYQSSVPLVPMTQMPEQDLQSGAAPRIYSKAGGIAQFADATMKGMLKGLQMKEERKYKTAEAVMQAQDAGINAARKNYEDLLTTKGAFEADGKTPKAETQAAYAAWQKSVNDAAEQRQAFAVPEKAPKQGKGQKKADKAADGAPAAPGFGGALKQFFERNPHIVPELAIIGMKAQLTPYGQMAPEQQQQKIQMDAMQRQEANQKVMDTARATYDKYAGRPNLTPQEQSDFENAKAVLTPITANQKFQVLLDPQGQQHNVPVGTEIPEGWKVYEKPTSLTTPKVGSPEEITANYLRQHNIKPEDAPPELLKKLRDYANYKTAQTALSSGEHLEIDPKTNQWVAVKTYGSQIRQAPVPQAPSGFPPFEDGGSQTGSPKAAASKGAGKGLRPPAAPGSARGSLAASGVPGGVRQTGVMAEPGVKGDQALLKDKARLDANAQTDYTRQMDAVRAKSNTTTDAGKKQFETDSADALKAYNDAKAANWMTLAAKFRLAGRDPWREVNHNGVKTRKFKDAQGRYYGTMDGVHWVNVNTGEPYPGR